MDASDLAAIHAELRYITYILYVIGVLTAAALVLACLGAYWTVKRRADQWDTFTLEAEDLLKREQLDKLLTLASAKVKNGQTTSSATGTLLSRCIPKASTPQRLSSSNVCGN